MGNIIIYTKTTCPYCVKAKQLLDKKGASYKEINIENDEKLRDEMIEKSFNHKTVPQIFIGDMHIGGFDDLNELDKEGKLDQLLGK